MSASSIENLLDAVTSLPPDEFEEFSARLTHWQSIEGSLLKSDDRLISEAQITLPPATATRLDELSNKSEAEILTDDEQTEYRLLAQRAERLDVVRVQALVDLSQRWGKSIDQIKREIGLPRQSDDA